MSRIQIHEFPFKYQDQIAGQLGPIHPTVLLPDLKKPRSIVERLAGDGPLAETKAQKPDTGRFLVRVSSFRRRLLDEDNLSEKYFCDLCRYAGIIPGDAPDQAKIEVSQVKVATKDEEKTLVEVSRL